MSVQFYISVPLMTLLVILQSTILSRFPILGITPQLVVLVTLAWGLLQGIDEGLIWAFVGGILSDLFSASPIGAGALALMVTVLVITLLQQLLPRGRAIMPLLLTVIGLLFYLFLNLLLLRLSGTAPDWTPLGIAPAYTLIGALFMLPIYWLLYAISRAVSVRRIDTEI